MKNFKNLLLLCCVCILFFSCPGNLPTVKVFVEELEVLPKYRCPTDDILVKWSVNHEKDGTSAYCYDYGITLYAQDKDNPRSKIEIYNTRENQGEILITLDETFANDIPREVLIIGEPTRSPGAACLSSSQKLEGSKSVEVTTIYDKLEVEKTGFNSASNLNRFVVNFDPLIYSDNLYVERFKINKSCNDSEPLGSFEFDKGIATANIDKILDGENTYISEFVNSPVNLIGDWLVLANSETGCGLKPNETIDIGVRLICLTP